MSAACTFATLAACFHLSGFYVDSSISAVDLGLEGETTTLERETNIHNGIVETSAMRTVSVDRAVLNPYGRLALGYELDVAPLSFSLEAWHMSSFASNRDRGRNGVTLSMRWHFFGGAR